MKYLSNFKQITITLFVCLFFLTSCIDFNQLEKEKTVKKPSILLLNIKGVIHSDTSEAFLKSVRKYASKDKVKGVLIRVNSPGGAVGASQEINSAIQDIKQLYKKPVYVSGGDVVASGGVYSTASADKIFVNAGTMYGSIGVVLHLKNLSELVRWAKIEMYTLKSGEFKDTGSQYRKMTLRERELVEGMLESSHDQFKQAIVKGRKLELKDVVRFADGRVFSGSDALEYGLVDAIGTFNDAIRAIGEKTGLGSDPILFDPHAKSPYAKLFEGFSSKSNVFSSFFSQWSELESLTGKPLYILPSYLPSE